MKIMKILAVCVVLTFISFIFVTWGDYFEHKSDEPTATKCYDKYGNELIEQTCLDYGASFGDMVIITVLLLMASVVIGGFLFSLGGIE